MFNEIRPHRLSATVSTSRLNALVGARRAHREELAITLTVSPTPRAAIDARAAVRSSILMILAIALGGFANEKSDSAEEDVWTSAQAVQTVKVHPNMHCDNQPVV